jgi:regulator of protease activity HflC (stomatin/prohibitin superfamily)
MVRLFWFASQTEEVHASHGLSCKYNNNKPFIINLFISSPEGTIAVVLSSGAFIEYAKPGFYACGPFTEAKYLVSMQDFVYESPNNEVLTRDNTYVSISLSILLSIEPEHDYVQQLVTNVT